MKQTGELLKKAREGAKLSVSEVALATKINPKILNAIEHGDMGNLPAKTFLKGFVRSYALYLKMDTDEVMKSFHAETGGTPPPQIDKDVIRQHNEAVAAAKEEKAPKRRVNDEESFSGLRAVAVIVIVVLIGVIIGVRELIEKYQKETVVADGGEIKVSPLPQKPPEKVAEVKAEAKAEEKSEEKDEKKEEPKTAEVAAPEPPAMLKAADVKPETKPEVKPEVKPEPKPEPVKVAEAKPVEPPKPAEVPKPAPVPVAAPTAATPSPAPASTTASVPAAVLKAAKNEIILEALDKVEVKFQVHGQTKKLSLAPAQVHTIFADAPTVLDISDGGAVNIILNGRDKGPAGDLGKPKQIKIP